jgi:hypothetical protein
VNREVDADRRPAGRGTPGVRPPLCREPDVDYVIVLHAFALPCAADNGRFYIL